MNAHSDALKRRWQDPVYRDRQVESNRRAASARKADLADPLARKVHGQAIRLSYRMRKAGRI